MQSEPQMKYPALQVVQTELLVQISQLLIALEQTKISHQNIFFKKIILLSHFPLAVDG